MKYFKTKKPALPAEALGFNIVVTDPVSGLALLNIRVPLIRTLPESEIINAVAKIIARAGIIVREQNRPVANKPILDELGLLETASEEEVRGKILALKHSHPDDLIPRKEYDA